MDSDLSAYLDGELAPAEHARVEAHLDTCDRCRSRLSELRATASLISALPTPRPSRSLVPKVETLRTTYAVDAVQPAGWNWLRPIRSFTTVASGAFLFLFLVTAVARSGSGLGGGTTSFGTAAAPAAAPTAGPAAPEAAAQQRAFGPPSPVPAPAAATPARLAPPAAVATPPATAAADARTAAGASPAPQFAIQPTPSPKALQEAAPTARADLGTRGSPEVATAAGPREVARTSVPSPLADPLIWLGLAVIAAVLAIGAHWRLRTT